MFLVGGPAYSGTTLLAMLLNHADVICLDEPAFHLADKKINSRSIPLLRERYPDVSFPELPQHDLSYESATNLIEECQDVLRPRRLGIKTCNRFFTEYARVYQQRGYPVVAIIRDVRDAIVSPIPDYVGGEEGLYNRYEHVWKCRSRYDLCVRYEDLVADPPVVLERVAAVLGVEARGSTSWEEKDVPGTMLKTERHDLLRTGRISTERVGIWRTSGQTLRGGAHRVARMMGYS